MILIEGLMKRYEGARLQDMRELTMNQILLLNHASTVNHERSEEYYEWKRQFKKGERAATAVRSDAVDVSEIPSAAVFGVMFGG